MTHFQNPLVLAGHLAALGVEPGVRYCGTVGCLHPGGQHSSAGNACLVCECKGFNTRPDAADLAVAVRIALDLIR